MRVYVPYLNTSLLALGAGVIMWHQSILNAPLPPLPPALEVKAPPRLAEIFMDAAHKHGVDATLLVRLVRQESAMDPKAVSKAGAAGLAQLMPAAAKEVGVSDRFDPTQSVHGGAAYLKKMLVRYKGDVRLALYAYNCGGGCVDAWLAGKRELPAETLNYAERIL